MFNTEQHSAPPHNPLFAEQHARACDLEAEWSRRDIRKRRFQRKTSDQRFSGVRIAELEKLYKRRYGSILPDDDAGLGDLKIAFHTLAHLDHATAVDHMVGWAGRWAPWFPRQEAAQLAEEIARSPKKFRADPLAEHLGVIMQERTELDFRTIGAIDATKEQRAEMAKQRRAQRKKEKRRSQGVRPRDEYEGQSLTRTKPWEALGISRATWYRSRSKGRANHDKLQAVRDLAAAQSRRARQSFQDEHHFAQAA